MRGRRQVSDAMRACRAMGALVGLVWLAIAAVGAAGQQPVQPVPQPPPQTGAQPPGGTAQRAQPTAAPAQPETYAYNPEGRRDPFVSLLNRGAIDLGPEDRRPSGLTGLTINEVALRGIVLSRGSYVAILQAPDTKTYIVRPNDRLYDGTVKSITADTVVFMQEVHDPLSLVKQREVRKSLRMPQEGR